MTTDLMEVTLWYTVIGICFLMMIIFFLQWKKRDSLQKPFFLGLVMFALFYFIARLIENVRRYSIGSYNDVFDAWIAGSQISGLNFVLRILYYIFSWIGLTVMFYNIEKHIFKKNKFLLTIVSATEGTVSIINYFIFNLVTFWLSTILFFVIMFIPLMFFNLARKTPPGSIRRACIVVGIGIVLFAVGVMIDLPEFSYFNYLMGQQSPEEIIRLISPIIIICALIMLNVGFRTFFPKG